MPYARPTLTQLRTQIAQDIQSNLPGADPLLRFSVLGVVGVALAGLIYLVYGFLDWIAVQGVPFTATDEYLEGWAGLKGIVRKPATSASGVVTFTGTNGTTIPSGTPVVRGDGVDFLTTSSVAVSGSSALVPVTAVADPTGLTGAFGNTAAGVVMTLGTAIAGVQSNSVVSTALVGGADLESDDELRSRMLYAYQNPPMGGAATDYINWALAVTGVTRAWCVANGFGLGTVTVYIMLDDVETAYNGFPQGTNGVAADETRSTPATGDQLTVANALFIEQPVTALVYACAPVANPIAFAISGIPAGARAGVPAAIADVFLREGSPLVPSIPIAHIWQAISTVSGVNDFVITSPASDISNPAGNLPTVGTIAFS